MGTTKRKNGDGHIIFHVGKELPAKNSNLMLVPGIQKAQGRGVYFSDEPRLKYSGGEHFQKELKITPIFCVPMSGKWMCGKNKKKGGEVSYHSDQNIIALFGLNFFDGEINGLSVRYYYPQELSFFHEPDVIKNGRHITSHFSDHVLQDKIDFNEAVRQLREEYKTPEEHINEAHILKRMKEAIENGRLPENTQIDERMLELRVPEKNPERMKISNR